MTTDGSFAVETHVLDRDIGKVEGKIELAFQSFIRENKKFSDLNALKSQIEKDIEQARVT